MCMPSQHLWIIFLLNGGPVYWMHSTLSCTVKLRDRKTSRPTWMFQPHSFGMVWQNITNPLNNNKIEKFETHTNWGPCTHRFQSIYSGEWERFSRNKKLCFFKHMYEIQINGVNICFRGDEIHVTFCIRMIFCIHSGTKENSGVRSFKGRTVWFYTCINQP